MRACISCGYDLSARALGARCPECGQAPPAFELTGGLADGGARSARGAARTATAVVVLLSASTAMAVLVSVVESGAATNLLLSMAMVQTRAASHFVGALLCVLVIRMLPRDSAWTRVLWIVLIARVARAVLCELVGLGVIGSPTVGSLVDFGEHQVPHVGDLLVAIAIARIAPTGGLSNASRAPAVIAAAAAACAMLLSQRNIEVDSSGIAVGLICSGVIAAVACAVALRRIARELHASAVPETA